MTADTRPIAHDLPTGAATLRPVSAPLVLTASDQPRIRTELIPIETTGPDELWDLTATVGDVVARSRVHSGQVTIHSPHTTTTIMMNEAETGLLNDLRHLMSLLVPVNAYYEHDDLLLRTENLQDDEFVNGHAHCRALLVGQPSVTVPVVDAEIALGRWQRILFCELDQARERHVFVHVQGV